MAIYGAAVKPVGSPIKLIELLRHLTPLPLDEIQRRLTEQELVVSWDTDDIPGGMNRIEHLRNILRNIQTLIGQGHELGFFYKPAVADDWEAITLDQLRVLFETDELDGLSRDP